MQDPLGASLRLGSPCAASRVAASIARALAPAEHAGPDAPWLRPEQVIAARRLRAALDRYRGALLANPVGSGKTFVALAAAWSLGARRLACIVPAALVPQWRAALRHVGLSATCWSHERLGRGRAPELRPDVVIVDESHRFRNPGTRRYATLARWIAGAPTVLVSATPVVNRLADLGHQLVLAARDDALRAHGVASLEAMLGTGRAHPALGELIVATDAAGRPAHATRCERVESDPTLAQIVAGLCRLRLSPAPAVAHLIRGILLRALASSPAALGAALRRYRSLLRHAEDASAAGRSPGRALVRALSGAAGDQLVLWGVMDDGGEPADLVPDDLPALDRLIGLVDEAPDSKIDLLQRRLADGAPTLVFTWAVATAHHLRRSLGDSGRVAWCTGSEAGIGATRLARADVLQHFGRRRGERAPTVLVTTDVAAEGLDLPGASRVVHYDLPWTAVRLEQREGRVLRVTSTHARVETVRLLPPPLLERRLRQLAILDGKAALPSRAGLGRGREQGRDLWRWRADVAESLGGAEADAGVARVRAGPPGVLAGFAIRGRQDDEPGADARTIATTAVWLDGYGSWTERAEVVEPRLRRAAAESGPVDPLGPEEVEALRARLAPVARALLARVRTERWALPPGDSDRRRWADRLHRLAGEAARERDVEALRVADRALRLVSGGLTAGESMMLGDPVPEPAGLVAMVCEWPAPAPRWAALEAVVTGVVVFEGSSER